MPREKSEAELHGPSPESGKVNCLTDKEKAQCEK